MPCAATRIARAPAAAMISSPSRSTRRCSTRSWRGILAERPTVLIVDDEPLNRDLLEQELLEAGYRTLSAANGAQALELAAKGHPDLVLLDALMEGLDGFETCRRLKEAEATRAIPVIFLTSLSDTEIKLRAFKA